MFEFNTSGILLCLAIIWSLGQIYNAISLRPLLGMGWLCLAFLTLVVSGAGMAWFPHQAGYVSGFIFIVFGLVPQFGALRLRNLILHGRYDQALGLARLLVCLHPADGFPMYVRLVGALSVAQSGDFTPAQSMLESLSPLHTAMSLTGTFHLLRVLNRYEEVVQIARSIDLDHRIRQLPSLVWAYLRALAETGRMAEAFALYRRLRSELPGRIYESLRYQSGGDLILAAFTGRVEHSRKLVELVAKNSTTLHDFWLATARLAAGQPAQDALTRLLEHEPNAIFRSAIEHRLNHLPAAPPDGVASEDQALLEELQLELEQSVRYSLRTPQTVKPVVTLAVTGVIILMFVLEHASGGVTSIPTLWRLGAFNVDAVLLGDWWRLPAHMFLHYGWPHVILNMFALLYFGPFVEVSLGRLRYLLCYLVCGIGPGLAMILLTRLGWVQAHGLIVGASGAIMGILGATAAILLRGWRREAARVARRRFFGIVNIIVLQAIFDQLFPQVSSLVHMLGFATGFLLTLLFLALAPSVPVARQA